MPDTVIATKKHKYSVWCVLLFVLTLTTVAVVSLAVSTVYLLARYQTNIFKQWQDNQKAHAPSSPTCYDQPVDVAIIGAGASGTYTAWKLSQHTDLSIQLFDANDRVGGRQFSVDIPGISDFKADMGAMRFKESHTLLKKLIAELGLTRQKFTSPMIEDRLYYLRNTHLSNTDIQAGNLPYQITDKERSLSNNTEALLAYWNNLVITDETKEFGDWKKQLKEGPFVYEKGVHDVYHGISSQDALDYVAHIGNFPGEIYNNLNYAEYAFTDGPSGVPDPASFNRFTVREGFQQFSVRMAERFCHNRTNKANCNDDLFLNTELKAVQFMNMYDNQVAELRFYDHHNKQEKIMCAKKVILAISSEALSRIMFSNVDISTALHSNLKAVNRGPALKTFLAYDKPWWRTIGKGRVFDELRAKGVQFTQVTTDLPIGTILDIGSDSQTGKSLLLSYPDWWKNVMFWKGLQESGSRHPSSLHTGMVVSDNYLAEINKQLAKIFNVTLAEIPEPYATVAQHWYKWPIWTAWHDKAGGFDFPKVIDTVRKPVDNKELYIIGEVFSMTQAWTEGAIEAANDLLTKYFHLSL